jgi:hypothetical protein
MPELSVSNVYPIETAGTHDVLIIHSDILSSSDIYTFAVSNVYPIETAGKYSFLLDEEYHGCWAQVHGVTREKLTIP